MGHNDLLHAYEVDVECSDVSGFEYLDMLLTRNDIAEIEHQLTPEQHQRLSEADKQLMEHAQEFYKSIQQIASLERWRDQYNIQPSYWWWYLDVIAQMTKSLYISFSPTPHSSESMLKPSLVK